MGNQPRIKVLGKHPKSDLGAGGRRFESSRPDQYHQGLNGFPLGPFCVGCSQITGSVGKKYCVAGSALEWNSRRRGFDPHQLYFVLKGFARKG
jgi:hypothetical protein